MKTSTAGFRQIGSLIAAALIGLSIVVTVFAMTTAETGHLQVSVAFGSSIVLVAGFLLQIIMTAAPRRQTNKRCNWPSDL